MADTSSPTDGLSLLDRFFLKCSTASTVLVGADFLAENPLFSKTPLFGCILQCNDIISCTERAVLVAKIQKINLIGCHLMLKSVNFFNFNIQFLIIQACP